MDSSGCVYVPVYDALYAITPNGTIKWRFRTPLPSVVSDVIGPVIVSYGTIYALYPNNGTVKWVFSPVYNDTRYRIYYLTLSNNRIIALGDGPGGYYLYALLPNGSLLWRSNTPIPQVRFYPAIDREGNIYCTTLRSVYIFYPNGTLKTSWQWDHGVDDPRYIGIGPDQTVYLDGLTWESTPPPEYYRLYAFYSNGTIKWRVGLSPSPYRYPVFTNDTFYTTDGYNYTLLALRTSDGSVKWSLPDVGYPVAIDSEGIIYTFNSHHIGDPPPDMYAIWPDGRIKDRIFLNVPAPPSKIGYCGLVISNDGTIYVKLITYHGTSYGRTYIYAIGKTPPTSPQKPTPLEGDRYVNLTWKLPINNGGSPILKYNIYRGNSPENILFLSSTSSPTPYYNDTNLTNGVRYYYYITAVNSIGESPPSEIISAVPYRPPDPPQNLSAESGKTFVELSWDPPPFNGGRPITNYNIYRGTSTSNLKLLTTIPPPFTSYNDTDVETGVIYFYYLTAINIGGESHPSNIISIAICNLPTPPINLMVLSGDGYVKLSWDPPLDNGGANITEYRVYRGPSSTHLSLLSSTSSTYYNDSDVENGIRYFYYVTAVNPKGESDPSNIVSTIPLGLPSPPSSVSISAGDSFIDISWEPPTYTGGGEITGYNIYRSADNSSFIYYGHTSSTTTSFRDDIVTNGQRYFYYVTALNIKGESRPSSIVSAVPAGPPSPPTNINISSGDNFVLLSWEEPEDNGGLPIEEYRIYRGVNSVILSLLTTLPPNLHLFNDTEVENGITYYYYVTASNLRGESIHSKIVSAKPVGPPSPPENFTATSGDSFVLLTWSPPASNGGEEIVSYRIYKGESESNLSLLVELLPSVCSYNDTTVKNGKTYFYIITSLNSLYESSPSLVISTTPSTPPPLNNQSSHEPKNEKNYTFFFILGAMAAFSIATAYLFLKERKKREGGQP